MRWQFEYSGYIWPLLGTAAFSFALFIYCWRHRTVPGATALTWLMGIAAVWCLFGVLGVASTDPAAKFFWTRSAATIRVLITTASCCFVLEYAGLGRWLTRPVLALLVGPPLAFALLAFTNEAHNLAWIDIRFGERLALTMGTAGWLITAYGYLLFLVSTLVLIWLFIRSPLHRWPVAIILVGQFAPRAAFVAELRGTNPFWPLDPTMVLTNVTVVAYTLALFRFRLLDVVPLARQTVLERMVDGMLVLDAQGRIADLNPSAQELLGMPRSRALGKDGAQVLAAFPNLARLVLDPSPAQVDVQLGSPEARWYQVSTSPLTDRRGFRLGRLLVFRDITESKRAHELLVEQQRALAALQERERVARELHDGLGQVLGFVKMQAQAAQGLVARDPETAESYLAQLSAVAQDAHADIREYILGARATEAASPGFLVPLRQYLERFTASYGLSVELAVPADLSDEDFGPAVQVQLLRIIQEALTNARKHAHASHVQVKFAARGRTVEVVVADDGQGFDPEQNTGVGQKYGLRFMRERAEEVGGTLDVESTPGQSTRVVVRVPRKDGPSAATPHSDGAGAPRG